MKQLQLLTIVAASLIAKASGTTSPPEVPPTSNPPPGSGEQTVASIPNTETTTATPQPQEVPSTTSAPSQTENASPPVTPPTESPSTPTESSSPSADSYKLRYLNHVHTAPKTTTVGEFLKENNQLQICDEDRNLVTDLTLPLKDVKLPKPDKDGVISIRYETLATRVVGSRLDAVFVCRKPTSEAELLMYPQMKSAKVKEIKDFGKAIRENSAATPLYVILESQHPDKLHVLLDQYGHKHYYVSSSGKPSVKDLKEYLHVDQSLSTKSDQFAICDAKGDKTLKDADLETVYEHDAYSVAVQQAGEPTKVLRVCGDETYATLLARIGQKPDAKIDGVKPDNYGKTLVSGGFATKKWPPPKRLMIRDPDGNDFVYKIRIKAGIFGSSQTFTGLCLYDDKSTRKTSEGTLRRCLKDNQDLDLEEWRRAEGTLLSPNIAYSPALCDKDGKEGSNELIVPKDKDELVLESNGRETVITNEEVKKKRRFRKDASQRIPFGICPKSTKKQQLDRLKELLGLLNLKGVKYEKVKDGEKQKLESIPESELTGSLRLDTPLSGINMLFPEALALEASLTRAPASPIVPPPVVPPPKASTSGVDKLKKKVEKNPEKMGIAVVLLVVAVALIIGYFVFARGGEERPAAGPTA